MKRVQITELFEKLQNAFYIYEGIECWIARAIQEFLAYSKRNNFPKVLDKAKIAWESIGI